MHQTELKLSNKDRKVLEECRRKGLRHARESESGAHIGSARREGAGGADLPGSRGGSHGDLAHARSVPGGRARFGATRCATAWGAAQVRDGCRGRGRRLGMFQTASWSQALDAGVARARGARAPGMQDISRETIRRLLKKTASNLGES
jgi:hypothetical protein